MCEIIDQKSPDGSLTQEQSDGLRGIADVWICLFLSEKLQVTLDGSNSDLSKFLISRSKTASHFFSLYNKANLLPISRSSQSLELSPGSRYTHFIVFHSQSLEVLIANTRSPIKRVINTHWAYRYLDNGGRPGTDMNLLIRCDT